MTLIYLDSSALLKRIFEEAETEAFDEALSEAHRQGAQLIASALARVEVARAARTRIDIEPPHRVAVVSSEAFAGVAIADLTRPVLESARVIGPPLLRSLDAIHLATAVAVGADQLWTYDQRMATVAEQLGIRSNAPS